MIQSPGYDAVLLRCGELFLKRGNRRHFERALVHSVRTALQDLPTEVRMLRNRVLVLFREGPDDELCDQVCRRLALVPGYITLSPARRCDPSIEAMQQTTLGLLRARHTGQPWRVTVKRVDKRVAMNSSELGKVIGTYVVEQTGIDAELHDPKLIIEVELSERHAFVFDQRIAGVAGLPAGTAGRGLLLLSGGIDSPVAGHLMINRGLSLDALYFHSFPFISDQSKEKVFDLCQRLWRMQGDFSLLVVPFTEVQKAIHQRCNPRLTVVLYRRLMMRIASAVATQREIPVLVTGESLGQVASQTLENLVVIEDAASLPVLRPLIGTDKLDTMQIARRIGSFDISIRPFADCCSLFVPPHPETRARLKFVEGQEQKLELEALIQAAVEGTEILQVTRAGVEPVPAQA